MWVHTTLLSCLLSAAALAVAQAPSGGTGRQSVGPPDAPTVQGNSGDASAIPLPTEHQNDSVLQSQIASALRNEPALSSSHVEVNVTPASIDLTGSVGSSKDKQTAERIAQSFDGNRKLNDSLTITGQGDSGPASDHSAMNNGGAGNMQDPATNQANKGTNSPPSIPPQR